VHAATRDGNRPNENTTRRRIDNMRLLVGFAAASLWLLAGMAASAAESQGVAIAHDTEAKQVAVHIRGEHFTTLYYDEDARVPYLWPVNAEGGVSVTRNWPMGEDDPESRDHPHHRSMWTAFGDVNGNDSWHRTPITIEQIDAGSEGAHGWIRFEATWRDRAGAPVVNETRVYHFHDTPASSRILDQESTFTAAHGEVTFGENKEGFFALRIRPEIQGNRSGVLTSATGKQGEREVYGTPAAWMDYSGTIEGTGVRGIAILSHPDNLRLPAWHVRDYGLMGCNFFAMQQVAKLDVPGTHTLAPGETLTLRARYIVHSGTAAEADIAARFAEYAQAAATTAE